MADEQDRPSPVEPDGGFESEQAVRERLAESYVFELTYQTDDDQESRLVTHEKITRPSAKPLHGPPVFGFVPLGGDQRFTVRLPDVVSLHPVAVTAVGEPLRDAMLSSMLEDISSDDKSVPLDDVAEVLQLAADGDIDEERAQQLAFKTLRARSHEAAFEALAEPLFALLQRSETPAGKLLFKEVKRCAADTPAVVEPYVPELVALLTEGSYVVGPASCLAELADDDPSSMLDAVPALATVAASDDDKARRWAVYAFSKVAETHPEELMPALDVLVDAIRADDENLRTNALSALGRVTGRYPDAATAVVDDIVALLDSEDATIRGNAVGLLGDIARKHPEPVIAHAPTLATLLAEDGSADVRQNAALALINAGGADPVAVEAEHEQLATALDDSDPAVRANACTLVGNADAPVSVDRLRELRDDDPDERVREQAAWALNRLS
jgi:hypothetical protein